MSSIVLILVIVAAALAITSGIWVATALIRTLTRNSTKSNNNPPTEARP